MLGDLLRGAACLGVAWTVIHLCYDRASHRATSSSAHAAHSTLTVDGLSLHWSTTRLNRLPHRILDPFDLRDKDDEPQRVRWRLFWDAAALAGVAGVLVAQGVLLWATWASVRVLVAIALGPSHSPSEPEPEQEQGLVARLVRRGIEHTAADLVLRPVIPGLTLPLSALPLMLLALVVAQSFHELGHALAAACESIPLLSTGVHLWVALPTFYVSLPAAAPAAPTSELRIATAGVWHNLVLVAVYWVLSEQGAGFAKAAVSPMFRAVDGGVLVVSVKSSSPLADLLPPSTLITHLNDLELDSSSTPSLLWSSYLSKSPSPFPSYENLGWCLPTVDFLASETACCKSSTPSHELCFVLPPRPFITKHFACRDPMPLFPPAADIPPRCLESSMCAEGTACARPRGSEKVLRIGVEDTEGVKKTVVWQGDRRGVLNHVTVSSLVAKSWWVPLWLPRILETFYSNIISLSLALAFFNLLPLPRLDGSAILLAFLRCLHAQPTALAMEEGVRPAPEEDGWLSATIRTLQARGWAKWIREEHAEHAVKGVERWTIAVAALVGACSILVELLAG